jgi:hypothetical protein
MPFLYRFSLRSNMVYLSLGSISASVGIDSFHVSSDRNVSPFLASALSSVSITASTARRRLRWRAFWNRDSRQGVFLENFQYLPGLAGDRGGRCALGRQSEFERNGYDREICEDSTKASLDVP